MPPVNILGISAFYHDSAACLVRDGEIIAAAQEERFTRIKHDSGFPVSAVKYCLLEGGCDGGSLDLVVFHEKPFIRFERLLETYLDYAPRGFAQFAHSIPDWLRKKLWIKDIIRRETGHEGQILFPTHHETHAAAAFYPSPFPEAAILTMDGVGEWATASYGVGEGNSIELSGQLRFPHSLGLLYSAFTSFTGFEINDGEYKVMGLAPYGKPLYRDLILSKLLDLREDGSFRLNMGYFSYCTGLTMTNDRFSDLFKSSPRESGAPLRKIDMDLARSIQVVTEEIILKIARHVRDQTAMANLVMSGGVALNSVANGKLQRAGIFENIWIQPAAGDAGSALGAALYGWHQYMENERESDGIHDRMRGSLLGPAFADERVEEDLKSIELVYKKMEEQPLIKDTADRIANGQVIGWFQGRMEFGPRALGNRSILADARQPDMQEHVNQKIKFRESFRPFAPAVLAEKAVEYFDTGIVSPYMLKVFPINSDQLKSLDGNDLGKEGLEKLEVVRSEIPAVTHVDNSARVQTIDGETNPRFFHLLEALYEKAGIPLMINTSFNIRGEPLVCTPLEALRCFFNTDMDALVMGSFVLDKADQKGKHHDLNFHPANKKEMMRDQLKKLRNFGVSAGGGLILLSLILVWKFDASWWWLPGTVGIVGMMIGLLWPIALAGVHRPVHRATGAVSRAVVMTMIFLGYFGVVWPTGFLARILGKKFLDRGPDEDRESYWEACIRRDKVHSEKQY